MQFHYTAATPEGKILEGDYEAASVAEVLSYLSGENLKPLSVKPVRTVFTFGKRFGRFEKVTLEDKIFLMKHLSLMLKVGTDLFKAIDILIQDLEKPVMKRFLLEVKTNLGKGNPFYVTFQAHPEYFSPVVVSLLKAAETSGNLEGMLEDISLNYSKEAEFISRVRGALMYPILLIIAASAIVILLVTFLIPRIAVIFSESGAKIPFYSRMVLGVGMFLNRYFWFVFPPLIVMTVSGIYLGFKTKRGRQIMSQFLEKIPVARDLFRKMALERFASTLSNLLRAGIPMLEALEVTADAVAHEEFRRAIIRIAREGVARGVSIGEAFRREKIFPRVITNLVAIGEKAGHLDEILTTLASFYENEIDAALKALVAFIEPVLLIGIGLIVAILAMSVIVPIYQLVSQY